MFTTVQKTICANCRPVSGCKFWVQHNPLNQTQLQPSPLLLSSSSRQITSSSSSE